MVSVCKNNAHYKQKITIESNHVRFIAILGVKKLTEITCDGFRPISNMLDISLAMGTFSYKK